MYIAELIGTSSKVEGDLPTIRTWISLCCHSALSRIKWDKVEALEKGKAIKYNVSPYVLKISHPQETVEVIEITTTFSELEPSEIDE